MGRIFEKRKTTMFARWDRMAKQFTRVAREIQIAVKSGGPDADTNPTLRRALQNARAVNMPKDKIEGAIKRASGQDQKDFEILIYEGYAPHGIAVVVETATDNPQRTVANLRSIFNKKGGNLGQSGSVSFLFDQMGTFRLDVGRLEPGDYDPEEVELDLIDHGLEEMGEAETDDGKRIFVARCAFQDFGSLQAAIEERKLPLISAEAEYVPQTLIALDDSQSKDVLELVDAVEQDDDVQRVFHNLD